VVREKVEKPDFSAVNWLPELSFATGVLRASQLEKLQVINQFLIERRHQLTVTLPFRERALEIFGDEKAFDGVVKGDLLYGKIPLSAIGACNPEPPLAREDFVGSSGALLVLENHHTYWSMLQWNQEALRYRSIGYGSGNTILKSARAIGDALARSGAPYAEYFGDLDPTGVYIASMLDRGLREQGSPSLQAAGPFYRWLLANGRRRPLGGDKRISVGSTVEWLPPDLLEEVRLLFETGQWIPQESLSLHVLQNELFVSLVPEVRWGHTRALPDTLNSIARLLLPKPSADSEPQQVGATAITRKPRQRHLAEAFDNPRSRRPSRFADYFCIAIKTRAHADGSRLDSCVAST